MLNSAVITKPNRNVFAVLDVGSTKMACFTVKIHNGGEPEIIGISYKVADGINGGAITNIQSASYSILSSIDIAEQISGETIDQVYINISGCGISSVNLINEIRSTIHEISDRDIRRIILQTYEKCDENSVVVHNIPIIYNLDNINNITELRGLYGSRLSANMHVVTASKTALLNIEHCLSSCNLNMAGCVAEPYASGLSCLSEDERELGTIIIDIGGNYTSLALFDKGKFVHVDSVSIGGSHITRDIAYGLCTSIENAERIKILYGNVVLTSNDHNDLIDIDSVDGEDVIQVLRSELVSIIRPRVEEILEIIKVKLDKKKNLIGKVVITGGSSQISGMKEIANYVLNRQVRIGVPVIMNGISGEYSRNPIFSAAIGIVLLISKTFYKDGNHIIEKENRFKKFFKWSF